MGSAAEGRARRAAVGRRLLHLRLAKDVSQKAVANAVERSDGWLSLVEQGKIDVPLSRLLALADELDAELTLQPRSGQPDPADRIEAAIDADPNLDEQRRTVLKTTYRALRTTTPFGAHGRASGSSRAAHGTRTTGTGSPKMHTLRRSGSSP